MSEAKPQAVQFGSQPPGTPAVAFGTAVTAGVVAASPAVTAHDHDVRQDDED